MQWALPGSVAMVAATQASDTSPFWSDPGLTALLALLVSLLAFIAALVAFRVVLRQVRLAKRTAAMLEEQLESARRQVTLAEQHAASSRRQLVLAEQQAAMAEQQHALARDLGSIAEDQVDLAESERRSIQAELQRRPALSLFVRYQGQDETEVIWLLCLINRGQQLAHGVHWHLFVPVEYPFLKVYVDKGATLLEPADMASMNFSGVHHQYSHFFERPLFPQHGEVCATIQLSRKDPAVKPDADIRLSWLLFSESGTFPIEGEDAYLHLRYPGGAPERETVDETY